MTIKTRWFGKRIEGEALESLIIALGENPELFLKTSSERWSPGKAHGRASFSPTEEGVNVDLYIFRKDFHIKDGTIPSDNPSPSPFYTYSQLWSDKTTQPVEEHIQGEIKYQNVS